MRKDFKDKIEQSFDFGDQGRQTEVCCLISCICGGAWARVCVHVCVCNVCAVSVQGRVRKAGRWRVKCREYVSFLSQITPEISLTLQVELKINGLAR